MFSNDLTPWAYAGALFGALLHAFLWPVVSFLLGVAVTRWYDAKQARLRQLRSILDRLKGIS